VLIFCFFVAIQNTYKTVSTKNKERRFKSICWNWNRCSYKS